MLDVCNDGNDDGDDDYDDEDDDDYEHGDDDDAYDYFSYREDDIKKIILPFWCRIFFMVIRLWLKKNIQFN